MAGPDVLSIYLSIYLSIESPLSTVVTSNSIDNEFNGPVTWLTPLFESKIENIHLVQSRCHIKNAMPEAVIGKNNWKGVNSLYYANWCLG